MPEDVDLVGQAHRRQDHRQDGGGEVHGDSAPAHHAEGEEQARTDLAEGERHTPQAAAAKADDRRDDRHRERHQQEQILEDVGPEQRLGDRRSHHQNAICVALVGRDDGLDPPVECAPVDACGVGGRRGRYAYEKGDGARVGGKSGIMRDVEPGEEVVGSPALPKREFFRQVAALARLTRPKKKREPSS